MTRVANALHGRQMKVGTRRRRAPDGAVDTKKNLNN